MSKISRISFAIVSLFILLSFVSSVSADPFELSGISQLKNSVESGVTSASDAMGNLEVKFNSSNIFVQNLQAGAQKAGFLGKVYSNVNHVLTLLVAFVIVYVFFVIFSMKVVKKYFGFGIVKVSLFLIGAPIVIPISAAVIFILLGAMYGGFYLVPTIISFFLAIGQIFLILKARNVPILGKILVFIPPFFLFLPLIILESFKLISHYLILNLNQLALWFKSLVGETIILKQFAWVFSWVAPGFGLFVAVALIMYILIWLFKLEGELFYPSKYLPDAGQSFGDERFGATKFSWIRSVPMPHKLIKDSVDKHAYSTWVIPLALVGFIILFSLASGIVDTLLTQVLTFFLVRGVILGLWIGLGPAKVLALASKSLVNPLETVKEELDEAKEEKEAKEEEETLKSMISTMDDYEKARFFQAQSMRINNDVLRGKISPKEAKARKDRLSKALFG